MKDINGTVVVDLTHTEEDILKNLQKDARYGIHRAQRDGLIVERAIGDDNWNEYYNIYKETLVEGGGSTDSLEELKKESIVFFVCKKEGKIIAGATIKMKRNRPTLYTNASIKEYQINQPNNLLYWECILWCKKKGYTEFDLGGWQINAFDHLSGVNNFKVKWGKVEYYFEEYPFVKAMGRKLIRNFKFFWWLNKKLKGRK